MHRLHGFQYMMQWEYTFNSDSKAYNEFNMIERTCRTHLGENWSKFYYTDGKWRADRETVKTRNRIYFRKYSYITIVHMAMC